MMMTIQRCKQLVDKFSRHRVLVIGDVILDRYLHGVVERINPEAPVPILRVTGQAEMTGGAGNVAKNATSLGATTTLISVVGDDDDAQRISQAAKSEGYEAILLRDPSRPTIRKVRHLVGSQQLLRVDYEETHPVDPAIERELIDTIIEKLKKDFDAVVVSDYAKGVITRQIAETILDEAGRKDLLVAADVKPAHARHFVGASFISPNLKEGHEFLGLNVHEELRPPAEVARQLCQQLSTDVYLTLGPDGMYVDCGGECGFLVPQEQPAEVFDVSGAGDTALVVILLTLLSGATPIEAAQLGNAAGAVVVGKIGSVPLTAEELENMVSRSAS